MGTELRFPADGPAYHVVTTQWDPPRLTEETAAEARAFGEALAEYMTPAPASYIKGRVATTLAHYFVPEIPAPLQRAMLDDWLSALAEFPAWAVEAAARAWLLKDRRKPTISDIVELCRVEVRSLAAALHVVREALDKHDGAGRFAMPAHVERIAVQERRAAGIGPG